MRDPATPRVFVSYSRTDSLEFARRLHDLLEGEGLSLYRDLSDLEGGEDWWRQVEAVIRTVEHVVLVLSPAALRSPYVVREWRLARQEGKKMSPVSGPGVLDFSHLPRWMGRAHRHDIDIPESRAMGSNAAAVGLRDRSRTGAAHFRCDTDCDRSVPAHRADPWRRLRTRARHPGHRMIAEAPPLAGCAKQRRNRTDSRVEDSGLRSPRSRSPLLVGSDALLFGERPHRIDARRPPGGHD